MTFYLLSNIIEVLREERKSGTAQKGTTTGKQQREKGGTVMREQSSEKVDRAMGIAERQTRLLGPLEHSILNTLWSRGELSGKEVFHEIKSRRHIALTTVLTVLERLMHKGIVTKRKGESVYLFAPRYSRDEFTRRASGDLFRDIIEISSSGATASFVDMLADSDPEGLDTLAALIESKREALKAAKP